MNSEMLELVNAIIRRCMIMSMNPRLDAFCSYLGHTNGLDVYVNIDASYEGFTRIKKSFEEVIYLDGEDAIKQLDATLELLIKTELDYIDKGKAA